MGPFSLTGQPNAMGGREVGGLANQLAAHMGFAPAEIDRVRPLLERAAHGDARRPQGRADVRGDRARRDQGAVGDGDQSGGVAAARRRGARGAEASSSCSSSPRTSLSNDTVNAGAHVLLPAAAWGEKDGTVTNSERRISRQRAFLPSPGEAQARLVDRHARSRGAWALPTRSPIARRPTSSASTPRCRRSRTTARATSISAASRTLERRAIRRARAGAVAGARVGESASGDRRTPLLRRSGGFFTPDRKARFVAPEPPALQTKRSRGHSRSASTPAACATSGTRMTRTGLSPRLGRASAGAVRRGASGTTRAAAGLARWRLRPRLDRARRLRAQGRGRAKASGAGSLFVPIHWSDATASAARVGDLVAPRHRSVLRPAGGQGDAGRDRAGRVRLSRLRAGAATASRCRPAPGGRASRSRAATASCSPPTTRRRIVARAARSDMFGPGAELAEYRDEPRGVYRVAAFVDGRLDGCLFVGPADPRPHGTSSRRASRPSRSPAANGACCCPAARRTVSPTDRADGLRLLRRRPGRDPRRRSRRARPPTSKRSAARCGPAPIAARACRN